MPTYEYRCDACSHEFETEQRIKDNPLKDCPKCKKPKLERLISATAFHLKGGGWYRDAYQSKKGARTDNDRTDSLQKAIDKDQKKTETKTEKKSEQAA
jgi:putative FmdB family regulatory protein